MNCHDCIASFVVIIVFDKFASLQTDCTLNPGICLDNATRTCEENSLLDMISSILQLFISLLEFDKLRFWVQKVYERLSETEI